MKKCWRSSSEHERLELYRKHHSMCTKAAAFAIEVIKMAKQV